MRTNIQLDFGDGTAVSYSNLSWTQEGIRHVYRSAGIFRVTALAENSLGFDASSLYLHVTCRWSSVHLALALVPVVLSTCVCVGLFQARWSTFSCWLHMWSLRTRR